MTLPFRALGLLFRDFRLMALTFFPGAFTFLASTAITWFAWSHWLAPFAWWIEIPGTLAAFFLSWLFLGNIALLPVEDAIVDRVQILTTGSVRYPSTGISLAKIFRELSFSALIAVIGLIVFVLGWIPGVGAVAFFFTALLTAYSFLATPYSRTTHTVKSRVKEFLKDAPVNLLLGLFLNVLLFLPIVNVFLLGYALILSTMVFLKRRTGPFKN